MRCAVSQCADIVNLSVRNRNCREVWGRSIGPQTDASKPFSLSNPIDPARSERLSDDLRGLVAGDVLSHPISLNLYASDGGPFFVRPSAVVQPRDETDVQAVV